MVWKSIHICIHICILYCWNFLIGSILYTDNRQRHSLELVFLDLSIPNKKSAQSQQIGLFPQIGLNMKHVCCHERKQVVGAEDRKQNHPNWSTTNLTLPKKKKC